MAEISIGRIQKSGRGIHTGVNFSQQKDPTLSAHNEGHDQLQPYQPDVNTPPWIASLLRLTISLPGTDCAPGDGEEPDDGCGSEVALGDVLRDVVWRDEGPDGLGQIFLAPRNAHGGVEEEGEGEEEGLKESRERKGQGR